MKPDLHVAVVGSREYPRPDAVRRFVAGLPRGTIVVSGGARGVDDEAETAAVQHGLQKLVYPADWNRFGNKAGYVRNELIVNKADVVVAFWDFQSPGTAHSIALALAAGKPLRLFGPDGTLVFSGPKKEAA